MSPLLHVNKSMFCLTNPTNGLSRVEITVITPGCDNTLAPAMTIRPSVCEVLVVRRSAVWLATSHVVSLRVISPYNIISRVIHLVLNIATWKDQVPLRQEKSFQKSCWHLITSLIHRQTIRRCNNRSTTECNVNITRPTRNEQKEVPSLELSIVSPMWHIGSSRAYIAQYFAPLT